LMHGWSSPDSAMSLTVSILAHGFQFLFKQKERVFSSFYKNC
jgi:hypothetical protein